MRGRDHGAREARSRARLAFLIDDWGVEAFRAEFVAFLEEHLPSEAEAGALERPRSSSHIPGWARRWQRLLFDNGWLLPGNPPEFGGRNASLLQQYVHLDELSRRRIIDANACVSAWSYLRMTRRATTRLKMRCLALKTWSAPSLSRWSRRYGPRVSSSTRP